MDFFQLQIDQENTEIYQGRSEVVTFLCVSTVRAMAILQKRR